MSVNIASHLPKMAASQPYVRAVVFPASRDRLGRVCYSHYTFGQLNEESDGYARGFEEIGITRGVRTILMVKPSLEFFALTFALFKVGAVPVLIDPGMGLKRMLHCLQETEPEAFVGIPLAQTLRRAFPKYFRTVKVSVIVGKSLFGANYSLEKIKIRRQAPYVMAETKSDDPAAILFTTGSTGPAKGVVYEHGMFDAQVRLLQRDFRIAAGEIDLPTFPLFALFAPALGMTAIVPDMDPTKPAQVDPRKIVEAIHNQGVSNMFASPALLHRVVRYCLQQQISLPSLKRVISAGAPVPYETLRLLRQIIPEATQVYTPYGATESLPISMMESREILDQTQEMTAQGKGICVGRPLEEMQVKVIAIEERPLASLSEATVLASGKIGELIVKGPVVTKEYYAHPEKTRLAKIYEPEGVWHRMGDVGWLDNQGRIWFCGRKSHRVELEGKTLFTIPCEAIFNQHSKVFRSALVGVGSSGNKQAAICIELEAGETPSQELTEELRKLAQQHELTRDIQIVLYHPSFPVDIRHNAKIFREQLTLWAEKKINASK